MLGQEGLVAGFMQNGLPYLILDLSHSAIKEDSTLPAKTV